MVLFAISSLKGYLLALITGPTGPCFTDERSGSLRVVDGLLDKRITDRERCYCKEFSFPSSTRDKRLLPFVLSRPRPLEIFLSPTLATGEDFVSFGAKGARSSIGRDKL